MSAAPLTGTITLLFQSEQVVTNGKAAEDTLKRIKTSSDETGRAVEFSAKRAGLAMVGLTTSFVSTFYAAKGLEDMQLQVAKAHRKVEEAEQRLQKVRTDSKSTLQDIADAQRDVNIANEGYKQIMDNVQEAQVMFVASLGTMAITTIPSAVAALKGLSTWHGFAGGGAIAHAFANGTLTESFAVLTTAAAPWLAIALAIVAAFEGIAHVIKLLNPEIDITIEHLSGLDNLWNANARSTKTATSAVQNYGHAVRDDLNPYVTDAKGNIRGLSDEMQKTVQSWEHLNESLKKNELGEVIAALTYIGNLSNVVEGMDQKLFLQADNRSTRRPDQRLGTRIQDPGVHEFASSIPGGFVIINRKAIPVGTVGKNITHANQIAPRRLRSLPSVQLVGKKTNHVRHIALPKGTSRAGKHASAGFTEILYPKLLQKFGDSPFITDVEIQSLMFTSQRTGNLRGIYDPVAAAKNVNDAIQALITTRQAAYYNQFGGLSQLQSQATTLGESVNDIISTLQNPFTKNDIEGMVLYKKLAALAG
jgi:hypothetical protein